jgi:hypothetical protein
MYDETKVTSNYGDYDGYDWWVEGKLHVTGDIDFNGESFKPVENLASDANVAALIAAMKASGIMERDDWSDFDATLVSTTSALPTEEDISNVGHITDIDYEDGVIKITLDCKAEELEDADHGEAWGTHKWLAFAVETGAPSIINITFVDSTGTQSILNRSDVDEATALGIDAGGFVLYIKAEDKRYLAANGGRKFSLSHPTFKTGIFTIQIVEPEEDDT